VFSCTSMVHSYRHRLFMHLLIERLGIGGVFQFGAFASAAEFWNLTQRKLESRGIQMDAVILNYSEHRISPHSRLYLHICDFSSPPRRYVSCTAEASGTVNSASL
jgi:hypothetical protein